jgi:hypothetical protein
MTPESGTGSDRSESRVPELPFGRHRALLVVDPSVVGGALADNAEPDAPFSFRAQMQWLAGTSRDAGDFTRAWLSGWEDAAMVGPELVPVAPRPRLNQVLVEPWLAASDASPAQDAEPEAPESDTDDSHDPAASGSSEPATEESSAAGSEGAASDSAYASEPESAADDEPALNDTPGYAAGSPPARDESPESSADPAPSPAWEYAPFRLIAIVNRVDLAADACSGFAGEVRYVYAGVDPRTLRSLDLTLVLEVPYPSTRSAAEWARAWQDLAALPPGPGYTDGLAALTREIQADADPLRVRLRSNEVALSDPADPTWELREFQLQIEQDTLSLVQVPLELTPRADADPAELSRYVLEHAQEIERAGATLPSSLRAGAAAIEAPDFSWNVLGVSERLRRAFSVQTCNGCHGGDTASLPFRHIGPGATLREPAELSRFLYDPAAPSDELRRRSAVLDTLSATECSPSGAAGGYAGG